MWYRDEIIRMIRSIGDEKVLRYLWIIVSDVCKEIRAE